MSDETRIYVTPRNPNLNLGLDVDGLRCQIQFVNSRVDLDIETADALDMLLKKNRALAAKIKLVDKSAAEAIAKAHMLKHRGGPVSGGMHSGHGKDMEKRDDELRQQGVSEDALAKLRDELAADGLVLTEKGDAPAPVAPKTIGGIKLG